MTKFIFVTGGVVSSLGKGLTSASIGMLLEGRGLNVRMQKLDPYKLPHDHHELIAMVAPRPVIILGNDDYDWLGDESGYKSTMAAVQVFTAMGVHPRTAFEVEKRPFYATEDGKGKPVMDLFARAG